VTPEEFLGRWEAAEGASPLVRFEPWQLEGMGLSEGAFALLTRAGIPEDDLGEFATYVAVGLIRGGAHAREWAERWGVSEEIKERMRRLVCIGGDDGGNPICVDPSRGGGAVVRLLHDDGFHPQFVNSSFAALLECALVVRALWSDREEPFTEEEQRGLEDDLRRIDPAALEEPYGWWRGYAEDLPDLFC